MKFKETPMLPEKKNSFSFFQKNKPIIKIMGNNKEQIAWLGNINTLKDIKDLAKIRLQENMKASKGKILTLNLDSDEKAEIKWYIKKIEKNITELEKYWELAKKGTNSRATENIFETLKTIIYGKWAMEYAIKEGKAIWSNKDRIIESFLTTSNLWINNLNF